MTEPSLGASASRGAAVTLVGQFVRIAVQLGGIVILARLLSPSDYGLIAMVTAIIGIAEVFRDFGLSSAAIQARTISREQKSNLFWINSLIGLVLAGLVCAASWPVAALYGDDRLQLVTVILSSTFLLNGISTQFRADLNRDLKFTRQLVAEISGQFIALGVGVAMALTGFEYWSLVGQQVAQPLLQLLLLVIACNWFPGLPRRGVPMRGFLTFGANLVGVQLLVYISRSVDSVVVGARFGPEILGLYNRAFQLMTLPLNQINAPSTRVALPVLSRLQDQPERFAAYVSYGQTIMLNVVSFALAFCGAQAAAIIEIAIGSQWLGSVPIFQILLLAGFFTTVGYVTYWIFLAKGLTRSNLHFALVTRPAMIVMIVIGANFGVYGVAAAYALAIALMWPIGLWWVRKVSDAPALTLFLNGVRTILVYSVATVLSYLSTAWLPSDQLLLRLVVGLAALIGALALIAAVWPQFRRDAASVFRMRTYLRRSKSEGRAGRKDSTPEASGGAAGTTDDDITDESDGPAGDDGPDDDPRPRNPGRPEAP